MTEPRLALLLAWKIAEILSKSRPGDDCTPFAQDVILEVAAWLRKRKVRVRASVEIAGDLEREINQSQTEPEGPTDEELRRRFLTWWREEASAMRPHPDHDHEEHARRISEIAWANGAHVARWGHFTQQGCTQLL
jgi:hypothetical protein